jgi:HAD superfamily hydrolase (TIGR01509 family)
MVTHILFDHDGVLVDTEHWYFKATSEALAKLGFTMAFHDYKQHLVDGQSNWSEAISKGVPQPEVDAARAWRDKRYQYYLLREDIDIMGVAEVLRELSHNFKMAVVTTSKRSDFELIHRERSLLDGMSFVLCREDYVKAKPNAEPYEAALFKFGIDAKNAVVIEDSKRGLAAAEAAGIRTVKVHNDFVAHQEVKADYEIQALKELPELLRCINEGML